MLVLFYCSYVFVDIKIHNLNETSKGYLLLIQVNNPLFLFKNKLPVTNLVLTIINKKRGRLYFLVTLFF